MSDLAYRVVRFIGRPIFSLASRPLVLHRERVPATGAVLLAVPHLSVFDPALLIAVTPRMIHFVSTLQIFRALWGRALLRAINVRLLETTRPDLAGLRSVRGLLRKGAMVGVFPEGGIREGAESVLAGAPLPEAIARLAQVTDVPVLPCVVLGADHFCRWSQWLPLRRTRWAIAYGEPLLLDQTLEPTAAREALLQRLRQALLALRAEAEALL